MEGWPPEASAFWRTTVEEGEKEVVFRMELPGFEAAHLEVRLTDHTLEVVAREPAAKPAEKEGETPRRYVRRAMELPAGLDVNRVEAVYRNGVLEVRVPRLPEPTSRRIEVKT
jgi:HSP20 family protein